MWNVLARMTQYTVQIVWNTALKLCNKHDNYTFKQECKLFVLDTQTFWTCSKTSCLPGEAIHEKNAVLWIVIVIVIAWMTTNDQEWSLEPTRMVVSCSFGDRFGTVGLGYNMALLYLKINTFLQVPLTSLNISEGIPACHHKNRSVSSSLLKKG